MIYTEKEVTIRPLKKEDLIGNYLTWMDSPIVSKYNSHGLFPQSEKELEEFRQSLDSKNKIVWAILVKKASQYSGVAEIHIGNVSIQSINTINRSGELAIVIGEPHYYKKGIGTIACKLAITHAFDKLNLHRIWTGTAATNIGMQKVAEKLGMKKEGVFRDAVFLNGQYVDVLEYGILRLEWKLNISTSSNLYSELGITE